MAKREKRRKDGIDVVAIVTPNHVHFAAAKAFLDRGIHVICDKPLTTTLKDARKLAELVEKSGCVFALTHNYTGYPDGPAGAPDGGRRRCWAGSGVVQAEYAQDWLTTKLEDTGQKQAEWRNDPARSGPAGCTGDIATHAMNLAAFITGLGLESVSRRPHHLSCPAGRSTTTRTSCCASPAGPKGCCGRARLRPATRMRCGSASMASSGGLDWAQEDPNYLHFTPFGEPPQLIRRGGAGSDAVAGRVTRIPAGHPEGYLEGSPTSTATPPS